MATLGDDRDSTAGGDDVSPPATTSRDTRRPLSPAQSVRPTPPDMADLAEAEAGLAAEAGEDGAKCGAGFDWPIPPEDGWEADDLDRIPDLPPHTELIDGSLVFVSPQRSFHTLMLYLLEHALRMAVPEHLLVRREMSLLIARDQRPEPDILILRAEAVEGRNQTSFPPDAVVLAVEVVSPDSRTRDRERKPEIYATAGIPHFWRIEDEKDGPTVYAYKRDPATGRYEANGVHRGTLKADAPVEVDVDLSAIDRM